MFPPLPLHSSINYILFPYQPPSSLISLRFQLHGVQALQNTPTNTTKKATLNF